jgi:AcrR family transcriptional regulator
MARKTKDPDERRVEFLDTAQELFKEKGFYATSVDDIVERMGVAKGLFYYYFKTKEELVEQIVDRLWADAVHDYEEIRDRKDLNALEKLFLYSQVRGEVKVQQTYLMDLYINEPYSPLVLKMTERGTEVLVPILGDIIAQGVEEGFFDTEYPLEAAEFLVRGATALLKLDTGDPEQVMRAFVMSLDLWERVLGAERGTFMALVEEHRERMAEFARQADHFKKENGKEIVKGGD